MKTLIIIIGMFASAAYAQQPTINVNGVVDNITGSTTPAFNRWWSIYGQNLSNGSGSSVKLFYDLYDVNFNLVYVAKTFSATQNNPGDWYESDFQINFYAAPTAQGAGVYLIRPQWVSVMVCNDIGLCNPPSPPVSVYAL